MFKKFLVWIFKTIFSTMLRLVVVFIFIAMVAGYFASKSEDLITINENSLLKVSFPLVVKDAGSDDFSSLADLSSPPIPFKDYLDAINHSKYDERIEGLFLNLDGIHGLGKAQLEELSDVVENYKSSGKKIYAYGEYLTNGGFELAVLADSIFLPPSNSSMVTLSGFSNNFIYYKDFFEKIGVKANVIHVGDFKAFGENYSKNRISDEFKSEIDKIYSERFNLFLKELEKRYGDVDNLKNDILSGKFAMLTPTEALEYGLIDGFSTPMEIKESNGFNDYTSLNDYVRDYSFNKQLNSLSVDDKIAILYAEGNIVSSYGGTEATINPSKLIPVIKELREDETVKGVILRVNSGGGSALSSELIYRELKKLSEKKDLIVSMGNAAASGGYYISTAGEKIYADRNTITGSIGVVAMLPQFSGTAELLGINIESVSMGKFGYIYSPLTGFEKGGEVLLKSRLEKTYEEFKGRVLENRAIEPSKFDDIAGGRIWSGTQALELGLVDKIGGLKDALKEMKDRYSNTKVETYPKPLNLMDKLSNRFDTLPFLSLGKFSNEIEKFKSLSGEILFHSMVEDLD